MVDKQPIGNMDSVAAAAFRAGRVNVGGMIPVRQGFERLPSASPAPAELKTVHTLSTQGVPGPSDRAAALPPGISGPSPRPSELQGADPAKRTGTEGNKSASEGGQSGQEPACAAESAGPLYTEPAAVARRTEPGITIFTAGDPGEPSEITLGVTTEEIKQYVRANHGVKGSKFSDRRFMDTLFFGKPVTEIEAELPRGNFSETKNRKRYPNEQPWDGRLESIWTPYDMGDTAVGELNLSEGDVFYDLGSGYGGVLLLAGLTSEAQCNGIEMVEERAAVATQTAERFGLDNVTVTAGNIRDANFSDGNKFYLYSPFSQDTFIDVLNRIQQIADTRAENGEGPVTIVSRLTRSDVALYNKYLPGFVLDHKIIARPGQEAYMIPGSRELAVYVSDPSISMEEREEKRARTHDIYVSSGELGSETETVIASLKYGPRLITNRHVPTAMLLPFDEGMVPQFTDASHEPVYIPMQQLRRPGKVIASLQERPCIVTDNGQPVGLFIGVDAKKFQQALLQLALNTDTENRVTAEALFFDALLLKPWEKDK